MSQIFYEYVKQQELITGSDVIVVAVKNDPFEHFQKIPIGEDKAKYPDFIKTYYSFKVEKTLYPAGGDVPEKIIVVPANWDTELKEHKLYYLEGVDESPVYLAYEPGIDLHQVDRMILFLNPLPQEKGLYIFSFEFAFESVEQESQILALVRKVKATGK